MAFSTTRFYIENSNNIPSPKRSDAVLKRYESASDSRAWSNDRQETSSFLSNIIKRARQECSSLSISLNADNLSKDELKSENERLRIEIKLKDEKIDELHKLHNLTKEKWQESADNIKNSLNFEDKYCECLVRIEELENALENEKKNSQEKPMNEEKLEIKVQSLESLLKSTSYENNSIKEEMAKLMEELNSMKRAEMAGGGDDNFHDASSDVCSSCQKLSQQLNKIQENLQYELKKNSEILAQLSFARERLQTYEVLEAELNMYKIKYHEADEKIFKLKELLVQGESKVRNSIELKKQFLEVENILRKSERSNQELVDYIERLELDLREKEIYIESLVRRSLLSSQNQFENLGEKIKSTGSELSLSISSVQPGKVQSIVQQISSKIVSNLNCKCGLDNCQCKLVSIKNSNSTSMQQQSSEDEIQNIIDLKPESSTSVTIPMKSESIIDESNMQQLKLDIEDLRVENSNLQSENEQLKNENKEVLKMLEEIENQIKENEVKQNKINSEKAQMTESFRLSITTKEQECQSMKNELLAKQITITDLEDKLKSSRKQLEDYESRSKDEENHCERLQKDLRISRDFGLEKLNELLNTKESCQKLSSQVEFLKEKIKQFEHQLNDEMKKSHQIAAELNETKKTCLKAQDNKGASREFLINAIKDIKRRYDDLKKHQIEIVNCYEKKLEEMQIRIDEKKSSSCEIQHYPEPTPIPSFLIKSQKFDIQSLSINELVELHAQIRSAMMKHQKLSSFINVDVKDSSSIDAYEHCSKIVDELKAKYHLNDDEISFSSIEKSDCDINSIQTAPAPFNQEKSCSTTANAANAKKKRVKRRSKSTETKSKSEQCVKCVTISRRNFKK